MKPTTEFQEILEALEWSHRRCADALGEPLELVEALASGRKAPDRILRKMRLLHDIHNPDASPRARRTRATEDSRVHNPHDNWHGSEPHPFTAQPRTPGHGARAPQSSGEPAGVEALSVAQLEGRVHDLEDQLYRLRTSYRELSAENERLRKELTDLRGEDSAAFGPYAVLGVAPGDDWATIKAAYVALSREHHPDRGGDAAQMKRVNEAYAELRLIFKG